MKKVFGWAACCACLLLLFLFTATVYGGTQYLRRAPTHILYYLYIRRRRGGKIVQSLSSHIPSVGRTHFSDCLSRAYVGYMQSLFLPHWFTYFLVVVVVSLMRRTEDVFPSVGPQIKGGRKGRSCPIPCRRGRERETD